MPSKPAVLIAAYNADKTILGRRAGEIEIIRLEKNRGPAAARNIGLTVILERDHDFVAILDADDAAYAARFEKQVNFLKQHPEVAAVGTWARLIDERTGATLLYSKKPTDAGAIQKKLFFNIAVIHPSAMFRADILRQVGPYSERYPAAEDYEFFRRIAAKFALANIPEYLLDYQVSWQGQSMARRRRQLYDRLRIQMKYFVPWQWRAWAGVAKTLLAFCVPTELSVRWKCALHGPFAGQHPANSPIR